MDTDGKNCVAPRCGLSAGHLQRYVRTTWGMRQPWKGTRTQPRVAAMGRKTAEEIGAKK